VKTVDGVQPESLAEAGKRIVINQARTLELDRSGERVVIELPADLGDRSVAGEEKFMLTERIPFYVGGFTEDSNGEKAGIRKGDRIVGVEGRPTPMFDQFASHVNGLKDVTVKVAVLRSGDTLNIPVMVNSEGVIGVKPLSFDSLIVRGEPFVITHVDYGFFASIPAGILFGAERLRDYVSSLRLLFTKSGAKQVGGFGAIGNMFPSEWDWNAFWNMTAFLSIILAFMNILPIPALDGGHVLFLIYEMIAGKPAPQRVMEVAQMVGMVLLLGLILFANGNDIFKGITGKF